VKGVTSFLRAAPINTLVIWATHRETPQLHRQVGGMAVSLPSFSGARIYALDTPEPQVLSPLLSPNMLRYM